uniref:Uncharacterized protein n=1 Tax=Ditylenchus dipsaci TaxID=166011 RepID=A0A915E0V8_9BILA
KAVLVERIVSVEQKDILIRTHAFIANVHGMTALASQWTFTIQANALHQYQLLKVVCCKDQLKKYPLEDTELDIYFFGNTGSSFNFTLTGPHFPNVQTLVDMMNYKEDIKPILQNPF